MTETKVQMSNGCCTTCVLGGNALGNVEDLHLFTMVVEHQGIANAAARLNIAKSAVSRRLSLLEDRYSGIARCKWPTHWDTYIPITGGPTNGWQTREIGRHCTEASPS
jgi:hypothetical protein